MEPCDDQYSSDRNDDLYLYAVIRLCYHGNDGYYSKHRGDTNIYPVRTAVPECNSSGTSNNI